MRIQKHLHFWTFAAFEKGCTLYLFLFIFLSHSLCMKVCVKEWEHKKLCVCVCLSVCVLGFYGAFGCHDEGYSCGDRLRGVQYKQGNDVTRAALEPNSHGKQKTITPSTLPLFPNASLHLFPPYFRSLSSFSAERLVSVVIIHRAQWLPEVS